ncbi:MAG: PQQ-dependent sugar dehydrogenase [Acidimicrobiia bacterium]|nr:PQQ-dependent sugar dehydrogenase [Acidimicrobiia bacterium]
MATGFVRPNYALALPGTDSLLVMQADGTVWTVLDGFVAAEPYLDLKDRVLDTGIEQGLLGMAFHPEDPSRLFVYFTDSSEDAHLVELEASPSGADSATARTVLTVEQPTNRHQAGMVTFGTDGYLYLSSGDGGDGGTQGQNPESVLGTILRIDVDGATPYGIPPDNPFVGGGGAPEVLVYGLRNPWRFSIDPITELLFIGDVGQDSWEEINVVPLDLDPHNFGWPLTEGAHCFLERGCDPTDFDGPTLEFGHDDGCSVTGGFVYRGKAIPEIAGQYFYSDWCGRWIRSFTYADGEAADQRDWAELDGFGQINSFGLDANGELLVITWDGEVARIVPVREQ